MNRYHLGKKVLTSHEGRAANLEIAKQRTTTAPPIRTFGSCTNWCRFYRAQHRDMPLKIRYSSISYEWASSLRGVRQTIANELETSFLGLGNILCNAPSVTRLFWRGRFATKFTRKRHWVLLQNFVCDFKFNYVLEHRAYKIYMYLNLSFIISWNPMEGVKTEPLFHSDCLKNL